MSSCKSFRPCTTRPSRFREFSTSLRFDRQICFSIPHTNRVALQSYRHYCLTASSCRQALSSGKSGCSNATEVKTSHRLSKSIELTTNHNKLLSGSNRKIPSDWSLLQGIRLRYKEDEWMLLTTFFFLHFFHSPGQVAYLKFISPSTSEQSLTSILQSSTDFLEFTCSLYPLTGPHIGDSVFSSSSSTTHTKSEF